MVTGLDYMYQSLSMSIHNELKKQIKGGIFVSVDNNELSVDVSNGDLRWQYTIKDLDNLIKVSNARTIAKTVIDKYKEALDEQFFKSGKEDKNGGRTHVKKVSYESSNIQMAN